MKALNNLADNLEGILIEIHIFKLRRNVFFDNLGHLAAEIVH